MDKCKERILGDTSAIKTSPPTEELNEYYEVGKFFASVCNKGRDPFVNLFGAQFIQVQINAVFEMYQVYYQNNIDLEVRHG